VLRPGEPFSPYKRFTGSFIPEPLERSGLSFPARCVYARLARYAGENGEAWPKVPTLAADLATSETTIKQAIRELVLRRLIERIRRGRGRSNLYRFLWHGVFDGSTTIPPLQAAEIVPINRPRQLSLGLSGSIDPDADDRRDSTYQNPDERRDPACLEPLMGGNPTPLIGGIPPDRRESSEENPPEEENPPASRDVPSDEEPKPEAEQIPPKARPRRPLIRRGSLILPVPPGRVPEPEFDAAEQVRLFRELGLEQLARQLEADIDAERVKENESPCP
jgi:hypothetical protein